MRVIVANRPEDVRPGDEDLSVGRGDPDPLPGAGTFILPNGSIAISDGSTCMAMAGAGPATLRALAAALMLAADLVEDRRYAAVRDADLAVAKVFGHA